MTPTIHAKIDNYLAADLHSDLSDDERRDLHAHLAECSACRQLHQENKLMHATLENILTSEKADSTFEQRMLAGFRSHVPKQPGRARRFLVDLMRSRAIQTAAVTALLLVLIGIGRMLTFERSYSFLGNGEELMAPVELEKGRLPRLPKADEMFARLNGVELPRANASPAQSEAAAGLKPVDTYRQDDITRLGVRSSTDVIQRLPAATGSTVPNEGAAEVERTAVAGSNAPTAEEVGPTPTQTPGPAVVNRKLIRNATVDLEVAKFDEAVQKITTFANEDHGYVATTSSEKQENGKLKGEIVVKVIPENLDRFLQKLRSLGELKGQTLGTEDITKNYFDTDSRLKNARIMEQRLVDMLKTKTGKVADLLAVEKELGRVREEIEKMQGDLKFWDSQVQFSTVTISLVEKDIDEAAKFLLKERAQLALYTPAVEKIYNDIKALASAKVQITNAQLDRDNSGRISAQINLLIAPEESDAAIARIKAMARVENFKVETQRVAQGGEGMSENARTKRDKVELKVTLSRDEDEQAYQQTSLRIRTSAVDEKAKQLRGLAEKQGGRVLNLSFSRDADGREFASASLRVPMKNYSTVMQSLGALGKIQDVSVARSERNGVEIDEANAPADLSIQVYSGGYIATDEGGIFATLRQTIRQGAETLLWSLRMLGIALAFLVPWVIAIFVVRWIVKRIAQARRKS